MSRLFQYLSAKMLSGILILFPVVLIAVVLGDMVGALIGFIDPIAELIPIEEFVGVEVRVLLTLFALLSGLVLIGMLLETRLGESFNGWLERVLLDRIPGYNLAKNLTRGVAGQHAEAAFPVARVQIAEGGVEVIGLVVERHADESCTVFVTLAPTPTLGTIYLVPPDRVRLLDVPATRALNSIMQWGIGVGELLDEGSRAAEPSTGGPSA